MNPERVAEIVGGRRYDTGAEGTVLVAGDDWWDGHNWERKNRNRFLYRTAKGNYFLVTQTRWEGERTKLEPLAKEAALSFWEILTQRRVAFAVAFPGVIVEEA